MAARSFALLALGRREEALQAWESVAASYDPQTPVVREWIDAVRDFLTLSEASRPAVFKNLDGAFDPEEIFFVGTQAARLGMPEATEILGRAVDAGYPCWDALVRHPWITPIQRAARLRGRRASRRAGAEGGRGRLPRGRRTGPARAFLIYRLTTNESASRTR